MNFLLDVLYRWNRWGSNRLESGIRRKKTSQILSYLHTPEIIVLVGPRRSGKSTILYQVMDYLEEEGVPPQAMLHLNFEEPKLLPMLHLNGLDEIYECYRENIYPEGKAYLFLDEIQNIPEWERWLRSRNQTENLKIFVTGSSAKLMSREIATLLTGRHLSFEVLPLDFTEYLSFQSIELPKNLQPVTAEARIRKALNEYQEWGGFPAVTLAEAEDYKQNLLTAYFDDILYKDIVLRHSIRDSFLLRNIAVHLLTQTGCLISFQRIANTFQVSVDAATSYCRYLQEAFVVELIPFYSFKASMRQRHPHKVYALDLGLRNAVSMAHSADEGHLVETCVYHSMRRRFGNNVFYWKGQQETDFVIREGNTITQIWQVAAENLDDGEVAEREMRALAEAQQMFPKAQAFLVAKKLPKTQLPCKVIPLWWLLLEGPGQSTGRRPTAEPADEVRPCL